MLPKSSAVRVRNLGLRLLTVQGRVADFCTVAQSGGGVVVTVLLEGHEKHAIQPILLAHLGFPLALGLRSVDWGSPGEPCSKL